MDYNPSAFKGDDLPVEMVSWYDCIDYCNKRSVHEGLVPYYNINRKESDPHNINEIDNVKWIVTINDGANGYRLPTTIEWEYAASGGQLSKSDTYSGSDIVDEVAWYWRNSGNKYLTGDWHLINIENNKCRTKPVGLKKPNELGIYDMSGNVREWCWDWYIDSNMNTGYARSWRGGGWLGGHHACAISHQGRFEANGIGPDQGFRIVRNSN